MRPWTPAVFVLGRCWGPDQATHIPNYLIISSKSTSLMLIYQGLASGRKMELEQRMEEPVYLMKIWLRNIYLMAPGLASFTYLLYSYRRLIFPGIEIILVSIAVCRSNQASGSRHMRRSFDTQLT